MVWRAYSLVCWSVCECWGACWRHTNTQTQKHTGTQTHRHMEAFPCKLKREGVTEEHGRPWEKKAATEAGVPVWNPATKSPGLNAQWEWDVGWRREGGCGRECERETLTRLSFDCWFPRQYKKSQLDRRQPLTPLQINSDYLGSGPDPPGSGTEPPLRRVHTLWFKEIRAVNFL